MKTSVVKGPNGQPITVKHFDPGKLGVVQVDQNVCVSKQVATASCTKNIAWGDKVCLLSSKPQIFSKNPPSSKPDSSGCTQGNPGQIVPSVKPSSPAQLDVFFHSRPEDVEFFTVLSKSLGSFPEEKRQATKKKIMELVYSVATNKLDPSSMIFLTALNC